MLSQHQVLPQLLQPGISVQLAINTSIARACKCNVSRCSRTCTKVGGALLARCRLCRFQLPLLLLQQLLLPSHCCPALCNKRAARAFSTPDGLDQSLRLRTIPTSILHKPPKEGHAVWHLQIASRQGPTELPGVKQCVCYCSMPHWANTLLGRQQHLCAAVTAVTAAISSNHQGRRHSWAHSLAGLDAVAPRLALRFHSSARSAGQAPLPISPAHAHAQV